MDDIWRDALLYNKWANLELLDACGKLTHAQLQLTVPGTYGTIEATWMHLLAAEERYVKRLIGAELALSEKQVFPGIDALKERARRSGDALLAAASGLGPEDTTRADYDGNMVTLRQSLIVVQAIHHGNDHRTQIGGILETNSIEHPNIDVWMYGLTVQC
ncbi:MAG TPA: DinB family protein [Candidatus Dormibacteraeota bacterium]|nr:DinB family protein [Candidatus Dormibacteraeota bacterium]